MLNPEQTFCCVGDLLVTSSRLASLGFQSAAKRLEVIADKLLEDALDRGLDHQFDLESTSSLNRQAWEWNKSSKAPKAKRWLCCTQPKKHQTQKGKQVWASMCKYKTAKRVGWMFRIVGRTPGLRPSDVRMGGKKMSRCPNS